MDPRDAIEQAMRTVRERQAQAASVTQQINQVRGKAQTDDERVKVEVGSMGQLESIELDPRAMRMPSEDLAKTIVDLSKAAAEDAATQTRKAMETLLGEGVDWQKLTDGSSGGLDMDAFNKVSESLGLGRMDDLPKPPTFPNPQP
ncbi:YbaB/EbfC family nucleoid-associated protein [Tenggerimyces flavus]|uniref:YbaB/EbfC family nucleoid-associated protein n=1 Tax=Tenggerimyces flavus TaxID=1708749 RepID=A0ABV7Y3C4_9ACTN|nr:YbaB/EbfC family nucleoid-associated protein [Tenggerimyces flavus]MBM7788693.1 DNA-binding protein YbaB [Tenggerimyces flavus]